CFHCDWSGGKFYGASRPTRSARVSLPGPTPRIDEPERRRRALTIWREAHDPRGTIAEQYLASERRLQLPDEIAGEVIRFHPAIRAMIALLRDIITNEPCGIHRTFLDSAGRKLGRKMLGRAKGAAIKLNADENVTLGLTIGEGIETCIAAYLG